MKLGTLARLLLLALVTSSLLDYPAYGASPPPGTTKDTETEDLLGEKVNEMSYSDIEETLGNSNKSDKRSGFDLVNEENIDRELKETTPKTDWTGMIVIIIIFCSGPILFIFTAVLYCVVVAYEKCQKKPSRGE